MSLMAKVHRLCKSGMQRVADFRMVYSGFVCNFFVARSLKTQKKGDDGIPWSF